MHEFGEIVHLLSFMSNQAIIGVINVTLSTSLGRAETFRNEFHMCQNPFSIFISQIHHHMEQLWTIKVTVTTSVTSATMP